MSNITLQSMLLKNWAFYFEFKILSENHNHKFSMELKAVNHE